MPSRLLPSCTALSVLLGAMTLASAAAFADVFVIAHPSVQIAPGDVRDIFVGDKQFSGSVKLIPVDNSSAQERFLASALRMESPKYNSTWTKKSFREGLNPPTVKSSDVEVLEYVRRTPGAIGYVTTPPSGVTVIQKF